MEIFVQYDEICEFHTQSEEEYGDWSSEYSFSIHNVSLTSKPRYQGDTINVSFDVVVGDTVYVLYIRYSEGDSFGCAAGHGEIIWVFKDHKLAQQALQNYNDAIDQDIQKVKIKVDGDNTIELYNVCWDYFTNKEDIAIESHIVIE